MSKAVHASLEEMVEFARDGIVSKVLVKAATMEVSLFCMSTGQSLSPHKSSFPVIIHVLSGGGKVTLSRDKYEAKPNAWFYMPANLLHSVEATENLVFLLTLFKRTER